MKTNTAIHTIYDEREKFIIIGLTGRTGSGCTTVSKILQYEKFNDLNLKEPKTTNFETNNERKYHIIYNYAKKHWHAFKRLSMTDMIISFIVQHKRSSLRDLFNTIFENDIPLCERLDNELFEYKNNKFNDLYHEVNKIINECLDEYNSLKRQKDEKGKSYFLMKEFELIDEISKLQELFRSVLKKHYYYYIPDKNDENATKKCKANVYTYFLQQVGNNIRNNGDAFDRDFTGNHMITLARRANDFIKAIRYVNSSDKDNIKPTLICLDAIRNPYEATYFQDRYSSFYLVSVNTDNEERERRLINLNYEKTQIVSLDEIEYPKKLTQEKVFINQDIGACSQLGDIHIYNPRVNTEQKFFLTQLIVTYVTLMIHPGLITPSHIERCMQIAFNAKLNAGCLSRQVGAVITDSDYSIKAVGWNSVAEGQVPCNLRDIKNCIINKDYNSFSKYEIEDEKFNKCVNEEYDNIKEVKFNGRLYPYCFKDIYAKVTKEKNQVHTRSLHAEENAFLQIVKYGGEGIKGGNLFTTASPCVLCSKKAYQLGIKHIYYIDPYPDIAITHILTFGANEEQNPQTHLFYGAIGKAYTCLYTQRIAIKDELEMLIKGELFNT